MSRVHDALRRAEQGTLRRSRPERQRQQDWRAKAPRKRRRRAGPSSFRSIPAPRCGAPAPAEHPSVGSWRKSTLVPFQPAPESHLLDLTTRTKPRRKNFARCARGLNHLQTLQPLHTVVVTSPSPAEGKTFTAVNLALAEAHLAESSVLLGDFDLRRPIIHNLFQMDRAPGTLRLPHGAVHLRAGAAQGGRHESLPAAGRFAGQESAGTAQHALRRRLLFEELPRSFNWAIFDTPPLLFSADANLLSTLADGTILVVKIGSTTFDNVTRAMQSLCENNVLGIVANGARASELYSKYTYYYSRSE